MRRFLKNYSVQTSTKLIKDAADGSTEFIEPADPMIGPEIAAAYAEVAKDLITHAAVTIGGAYIVCKIIGRLCK